MNMRILPSEMHRIGADSLRLSDGSGYVGALAVYHELHCVVCFPEFERSYSHLRNALTELSTG